MTSRPPVWQMVKEAVESLGGRATHSQIRQYIHQHHSGVNDGTIGPMIGACSVNVQARLNLPESSRPRLANSRYDFLYRSERGTYELYDPVKHGQWEIAKAADGTLVVRQAGEDSSAGAALAADLEDQAEIGPPDEFLFPLERHLRDFLVANIRNVRPNGRTLAVYADSNGRSGVEWQTGVGPIDVLAVDENGDFVVFELKLGRGPDAAVGQLARYMGWVRRNLAEGHKVTGVIVAGSVDDKLRYAASVIPDVTLFEYAMNFTLRPAGELGT